MVKLMWRTSLLVLSLQCVLVGQGFASEMSFDEEEVAEDEEQDPGEFGDMVEEGKKLYEEGDYEEASLMFYDVLNDDSAEAEAAAPEAQYELAKTLVRMELYQGALSFYQEIVDEGSAHEYYVPALRGLVLM
ncbi:MAG: tetratricopeptide repeat protein, partial [Persicimonas sp.]